MFKISPIQDKELQKEYAAICGADFCPGFFAYSMIDQESNEIMGISQFEINEHGGYIKDLKPRIGYSDFEAMFILGRATMNFIDLCGAHSCFADISAGDAILMKAIGFKINETNQYFADMTNMFNGHCDGHHEQNTP